MSEEYLQIPFQEKFLDAVLVYPSKKTTWSNYGVILTHGAGGDMDSSKQLLFLTKSLSDFGFVSLRFTCKPPNFQYRVKVFGAVLDYVKENVDITGCIIGGRSMGGRVAAELASKLCNSNGFLVGVSCFSYPLHRPNQYESLRISHLIHLTVPLFIVNGTNDKMCRRDIMDSFLTDQVICDISMHWVSEADHSLNIKGKYCENVTKRVAELFIEWCQSVFTVERV